MLMILHMNKICCEHNVLVYGYKVQMWGIKRLNTVKPGNEDQPWGQKYVVFVGRWSSFPGYSTRDMKGLS